MKALGLIVEYNPFHNGHLHHLQASISLTKPDVVVAVMSGHFTQRGEPTIVNKWKRAEMALSAGIDLVIELPYAFGVRAADTFAKGSVSILNALGVEELVFGSESAVLKDLIELENASRSDEFQMQVHEYLKKGMSLPKAHALVDARLEQRAPNNTLGIQYLRAIREFDSNMTPHTIARKGASYNDETPSDTHIASATAVRRLIEAGKEYDAYVPDDIHSLLRADEFVGIQSWENHFVVLKQKILTLGTDELEKIHDMIEGLEHRFYSVAMKSSNFKDFLRNILTKRYTKTRIQRICANILTHTTQAKISVWQLDKGTPYVRVLGFSEKGRNYLRHIKDDVQIPIYSTFGKSVHPMLRHEQSVTAAYASVLPEPHATKLLQDEYKKIPIQLKVESSVSEF